MIITVTPNPSLDRTLEVARLERGEVLRSHTRRVEPGGKGINVARALHAHGHEVLAVTPPPPIRPHPTIDSRRRGPHGPRRR